MHVSPLVEKYVLTYFEVMHLHFCFEHCLLAMPRCIRVTIGARQFSLGQNFDSTMSSSCTHRRWSTGMVWVDVRRECDTHDYQVYAMNDNSMSTACVHKYKAIPDQPEFQLLIRELPQLLEGYLAVCAYCLQCGTRCNRCVGCAMRDTHTQCHEAVHCMS